MVNAPFCRKGLCQFESGYSRKMDINTFLFYFWAISAGFSGWNVITTKSPISSVFWLVLAFINAALLLLLLGIEFLPILFIIVYVGAIAILFLFVIMLLNIKLVELNQNSTRYLPVSTIIAAIFLSQLLPTIPVNNNWLENTFNSIDFNELIKLTNIQNIGNLLYTEYWLYFILSSMVLLVSMIGAIILCLSHENVIKRQDLFAQVATEYDKTVINRN